MNAVIIVLGAANSSDSRLSVIAKIRCAQSYQAYLHNPKAKILCTGGFGVHFNTTDCAHERYTK